MNRTPILMPTTLALILVAVAMSPARAGDSRPPWMPQQPVSAPIYQPIQPVVIPRLGQSSLPTPAPVVAVPQPVVRAPVAVRQRQPRAGTKR